VVKDLKIAAKTKEETEKSLDNFQILFCTPFVCIYFLWADLN
jgi:hypothetical protein